jgi:hypothetical protein
MRPWYTAIAMQLVRCWVRPSNLCALFVWLGWSCSSPTSDSKRTKWTTAEVRSSRLIARSHVQRGYAVCCAVADCDGACPLESSVGTLCLCLCRMSNSGRLWEKMEERSEKTHTEQTCAFQ